MNLVPHSIRGINDLPYSEKHAIYHSLIPDWVYPMFGIDPGDHTIEGTEVIQIRCPAGSSGVDLSVFHAPGADEPVLHLQMWDTFNYQLIVLLVVVNDPASPRYNTDIDEHGHPTQLGTRRRNIPEEIRAMRAGLVPGQVRRGLRIFRSAIPVFERFVGMMGHDLFLIEPLFYHTAIIFERYGFAYLRGLQTMKNIDRDFQPGGPLHLRLDSSTPFRPPAASTTVSGRSWAIHDGILSAPFTDIQMYKRLGHDAGIRTFPGAVW